MLKKRVFTLPVSTIKGNLLRLGGILGFWETIFAAVRGHEINEGFFVTTFLFVFVILC